MKTLFYIALLSIISLKVLALPVSEIQQVTESKYHGLYVGLFCNECSVKLIPEGQDLKIEYHRGCIRKTTYTIYNGMTALKKANSPGTWVPVSVNLYDD